MTAMPATLLAELDAAIAEQQLESVADEIHRNTAACQALLAVGEDDYSSLGNTRFGGDPDLPPDAAWPTDPDASEPRYANFIAQLNFAQLPRLPDDDCLPRSGILYLFVRYMESAAEPVVLDSIFWDGDIATLRRRESPAPDELCDEYLVDLVPQKILAQESLSIAHYRKPFRHYVDEQAQLIQGDDGELRRSDMSISLQRKNQIGQLLGFANAGDERENLYRRVVLARLGKRRLVYNDYWDSMAEYEACIESFKDNARLAAEYRRMQDGVLWLTSNREMIAAAVDEWRLLLRIDSNQRMNLSINDADPLYVFIRHQDLADMNFANLAAEVTQG